MKTSLKFFKKKPKEKLIFLYNQADCKVRIINKKEE